ncbi:alpha-protein kinase 3 [Xyrichtys novacula]|uniref:non-specific serine/threonine protein kinase n=1 Tax=Xyrichtys novacula TaxID=13765 RepID=A0AAV1EJX8_XYRNO|nr:alpha-protein kinase 3 [Xyrichtys novacula]
MGSRRITTHGSFGNGRSSSGEENGVNSRPGSCSYLSNVRPENRSTLCSVIAQLTEETQPFFEITLKSRAVSENCNVKFSCVVTGHPTPQVIWYKDDMQLDRYCGLPKYEVFRNGQSHSLHIYNCTPDDAAIYQASASNSKGIVACSGVLEVGEMNEYKIHQRYFGKLKQKAENKRRETEGKENQEPFRTISPDRTQRKRRSTMDAFLSAPSSTEDENDEVKPQVVAVETEARLQETAVEEVEEKPVPIINGEVSAVTNGHAVSENINKSGTYILDSVQKIFTAQKPKTPFVKKKLKISSNAKVAKSDAPGQRTNEEKRAMTPGVVSPKEPVQPGRNSEEVMEVEDTASSSVSSNYRKVKVQPQKSEKVEVLPTERPSKNKSVTLPSQKEPLTSPRATASTSTTSTHTSPAVLSPKEPVQPGANSEEVMEHEDSGSKEKEKKLEMQKITPHFNAAQLQQKAAEAKQQSRRKIKEDVSKTEQVSIMDVDEKSNPKTGRSIPHTGIQSKNSPSENSTVSPQRPCEQAADQLSGTETSPRQKNVSVSGPALLSEVTQAHTTMNRNDAPVILELPLKPCTMDVRSPQKTPSVKETTTTNDIQTHSLQSVPQAAADKMAQDTQDHSRGSNISHTVVYTDLRKSSLQSSGHAKNSPGCNVPPSANQSQDDTAIKTAEGTEAQVVEKVERIERAESDEFGRTLAQPDSWAPKEREAEMETETAAPSLTEQAGTEELPEASYPQTEAVVVNAADREREKNTKVIEKIEKGPPKINSLSSNMSEPAVPLQTKTQEITDTCQPPIQKFQEVKKPATTVISIAELLRAQIKALESTLENSLNILPFHADHVQDELATDSQKELKDGNTKLGDRKSLLARGTESYFAPLRNIKETLMEVYYQLNGTDQELITAQVETSPPVKKAMVIPTMSGEETGTTLETAGLHGGAKEYIECVMDIRPETKASAVAPPKHSPDVSLSGGESVHVPPSPSKEDLICSPISKVSGSVTREAETPLAVTPIKAESEGSNITVLEHAKDEPVPSKGIEVAQRLTPEIKHSSKSESSRSESSVGETNSDTPLDQDKVEDHSLKNVSLSSFVKLPNENMLGTNAQEDKIQPIPQDKESPKTDSPASPTPEASPSLRRRNCVSPIPSATPQELASGARRKIIIPKAKAEEAANPTSPTDNQFPKKEVSTQSNRLSPSPFPKKEVSTQSNRLSSSPVTLSTSPSLSRRSPLLQPPSEPTSPAEKHSPLFSRRKMAPEAPTPSQQPSQEIPTPKTEGKPAEKDKRDPFKAPQVIRKIRVETFADTSGHLKLWCQFFNVLGESTIKWYRNEVEIAQIKRNAGDETQVNLAVVQASCKDSGVYGCSITNEYGTDSSDYLLSADFMAGLSIREDLGVGEEIEMTPMIFSRGVADSGGWGNKFFGRIMMQESRIGDGCSHKVWRAKVIYGLEPVFESGNTCIIKVCNPITYGGKGESSLTDRNLDVVKQECKIQNLAREYCKIFTAEARVIEHFGPCLEVNPVYLMYRPANTVPYATVETDLTGDYQKYSTLDHTGKLHMKTGSEMERKCCTLQHWIYQWTSGNLLLTRLEGVDWKITGVGISVKSTGHLGLSIEGNPKVFEQFISQHQCNYFCGLLGLRSLKVMDSLLTPTKPKGSRSPLLQRKTAAGSSSPQTARKATGSPRMPRKTEQEGRSTPTQQKATEVPKVAQME